MIITTQTSTVQNILRQYHTSDTSSSSSRHTNRFANNADLIGLHQLVSIVTSFQHRNVSMKFENMLKPRNTTTPIVFTSLHKCVQNFCDLIFPSLICNSNLQLTSYTRTFINLKRSYRDHIIEFWLVAGFLRAKWFRPNATFRRCDDKSLFWHQVINARTLFNKRWMTFYCVQ